MHDDIQPIRLFEIDKCVRDFQFPCRWVPDMGYGFGYPQFNYYAPLPYYVMEVFHLLGFGILVSIKIYLVFITFLGVFAFYKLASKFWQNEFAGLVSALFYALLPYRAVNLYVRGAVGEYTAQALIPLILLFSLSLLRERNKRDIIYLSVSMAFLWMSHSISALVFTPFLLGWMIFLYLGERPLNTFKLKVSLKKITLSLLGALTISAFFVLPAFFERGLVHGETLTVNYFDFRGHFLSIYQILFANSWGYGSSMPGPNDQIMLGIGVLFWFVSLVSMVIGIFTKKNRAGLLFLNALAWASLFLMHSKSTVIWESLPLMNLVQFPWRFNAFAGIFFALGAGYFGLLDIKRGAKVTILTAFLILLLLFHARFFRPSGWLTISDTDKLSGKNWELATTISINDYLPITTSLSPPEKAKDSPVVLSGKMDLINIEKGSNWQKWLVEVSDDALVQAQIFYFPDWKLYMDGRETQIDFKNHNGIITFDIGKGMHTVILKLTDTPIRVVGNIITILGIPAFLFLYKRYKYEK